MKFWFFMFICDLLCPLIMLIGGALFLKGGPKTINSLLGYRTEMSMKNEETWEFAHKHCGKLWLKWGTILLIATIIPLLCLIGQGEKPVAIVGLILCLVQMIVLIVSIFPTEAALKRNFDEKGNRKA